ncbi:MAG: hypothetical protein WKG01_00105 [Kofleriaceae bacterium]
MQLEVFHLDERDTIVTTQTDARVPLRIPPQGGWAVVLGVVATNLTGCGVKLTTSFRDLCDDSIMKVDERSAQLVDNGDGRAFTTLDTVSNLQLCPTPTSLRNLHDQPFRFTVEVTDLDGKYGSTELTFVPFCPAGADLCTCECDQRYNLGVCPPEGPEPEPPCPAGTASSAAPTR